MFLVWTASRICPRPCENDFAGRRGARLIRGAHRPRIKDSPGRLLRFFHCAATATRGVFTQPDTGSGTLGIAALINSPTSAKANGFRTAVLTLGEARHCSAVAVLLLAVSYHVAAANAAAVDN